MLEEGDDKGLLPTHTVASQIYDRLEWQVDKPARLIISFVICSDSVFVRLKENIIKY